MLPFPKIIKADKKYITNRDYFEEHRRTFAEKVTERTCHMLMESEVNLAKNELFSSCIRFFFSLRQRKTLMVSVGGYLRV